MQHRGMIFEMPMRSLFEAIPCLAHELCKLLVLPRAQARRQPIPPQHEQDAHVRVQAAEEIRGSVPRASRWPGQPEGRDVGDEEKVPEHHGETAEAAVLQLDNGDAVGGLHRA